MQFVYGKNIFELEAAENKDIILHVLDNVRQWRVSAKRALQNISLYKAPLFLILFVIAKDSEEQGNVLNIDTEDFVSQFNSVIKKDFGKIYKIYPGLAKTLYFWANVDKSYHFKTVFIWEELLKWADSYTDSQHLTKDLIRFNERNPTCKILSQYFEFSEILNPLSKNKYHISFLNDSFINAFCFSPCDDWYFDKKLTV